MSIGQEVGVEATIVQSMVACLEGLVDFLGECRYATSLIGVNVAAGAKYEELEELMRTISIAARTIG